MLPDESFECPTALTFVNFTAQLMFNESPMGCIQECKKLIFDLQAYFTKLMVTQMDQPKKLETPPVDISDRKTSISTSSSVLSMEDQVNQKVHQSLSGFLALILRVAQQNPVKLLASALYFLLKRLVSKFKDHESKSVRKAVASVNFGQNVISNFIIPTKLPRVEAVDQSIFGQLINGQVTHSDAALSVAHMENLEHSIRQIDKNSLYPCETKDMKRLLLDNYMLTGRFYNHKYILLWHPDLIKEYNRFYETEIKSNSRLTPKETHYIAVMGAAAMRCEYLVAIEEEQFLYYGGDPSWVRYGPKGVISKLQNCKEESEDQDPSWEQQTERNQIKKLRRLGELNDVLAQVPWTINKDNIAHIFSCDDEFDIETCWKPEQLISSVLILLHYHALSSIAMSQGVTHHRASANYSSFYTSNSPNCAPQKGSMLPNLSPLPHACSDNSERPYSREEELVANLKEEQELKSELSESIMNQSNPSEVNLKSFQDIDITMEEAETPSGKYTGAKPMAEPQQHLFSKFLANPDLKYIDFQKTRLKHQFHKSHEFTWETDGYDCMRALSEQDSELMKARYEFIFSMTNNKYGAKEEVKTDPFRRAIEKYIQHIYGVFHDDYHYDNVNKYLNDSENNLKRYIKRIATEPHKIAAEEYNGVFAHFASLTSEEMAHISVLVASAKERCALTYFLMALQAYLDEKY